MSTKIPTLKWLADPEVFAVNREKAHSDHKYYVGNSDLRQFLNGTWKFVFSTNPQTRNKDFYKFDQDIESFDNIKVPGQMSLQGYGLVQYTNTMYPWDGVVAGDAPVVSETLNEVGGYVKDVVIDKELLGKKIYISFQGVQTAFYLYVNEQFVGYSEDSFTPADFDITDYVKEGVNRIGVEVYARATGAWLEDQDYWRLYGIFRDVYLYAIPKTHVRDLFIHTNVSDDYKSANLTFDAEVVGDTDGVSVNVMLTCPVCGKVKLNETNLSIEDLNNKAFDLEDVEFWSAEIPHLYDLTIELVKDGKVVETVKNKVGIRRFEIKNKVMLLNGKRIELNGVNRHEFSHKYGRCVTEEEMLWDVKFMKSHNINAVRTCHYPDATRWYELCDEYGIYLIDEANLETHGTWTLEGRNGKETNIPGSRKEWHDITLDRAYSMVYRDKNHPSVIIWSCGNESYVGQNINDMTKFYHEYDPSRIVHYEGVWADKDFYDTTDVETRMYAKPWAIEEYLKNDPPKPYMSCEYSHAMGNSIGGVKNYTDLLDKYEMYQGGFIWDYIDQSLEKSDGYDGKMLAYGGDFGDRPNDNNFCVNGLIPGNRKDSPKMMELKFVYQSFNLIPDANGVNVRNRNLFAGTDRYMLKTWLLADGKKIDEVTCDLDVAPLSTKYIFVKRASIEGNTIKDASGNVICVANEIIAQAALVLKYDEKWENAGFEQAFGETVLVNAFDNANSKDTVTSDGALNDELKLVTRQTETAAARKNASANAITEAQDYGQSVMIGSDRKLKVVYGNCNTGVYGAGFGYLFSKNYGGLISVKKEGKELLAKKALPCFYRASTDNDRGCGYMNDSGMWQFAEKWFRSVSCKATEYADHVDIEYLYELPVTENAQMVIKHKEYAPCGSDHGNDLKGIVIPVTYSVYADGHMVVKTTYPGAGNLPELPLFGMQFVFNKDAEEYTYYGKGPWENYRDRNNGARYGVFTQNATDDLTDYIIPQGCGNRTEVRELTVKCPEGEITFEATDAPLETTVLHYNETQLEEAYHKEELPRPAYTFVKVMAAQMGVGGDDSWGAHVHAPYRLYSEKQIDLKFIVRI